MRVFGISIPRYPDRYSYLSEHLRKFFGNDFEIVGVDGRAVTFDEGTTSGLSRGQIGCALSHIAAYRRMVELDLPCALIVEDDCVLPKDIDALLAELEGTIRPGEAIQLYNWSLEVSEFSTQDAVSIGGYGLYYPMLMSGIGAATAYVIMREAAEKIIGLNSPVGVTADNWSFFQSQGAVSVVRILHPCPVRILPFESTIASSKWNMAARIRDNVLIRSLLSIRRRVLFRQRERNIVLVDRKSPFSAATDADRAAH
jgi:glycosyl transferase family 25